MGKKPAFILISSSASEADMHRLCGVKPPEVAVLLKNDRKLSLLVSEMEWSRLRRTVRRDVTVLHPALLGVQPAQKLSRWACRLLEENALTSVHVPTCFPVGIADALRENGVTVCVMTEPPCPQREIKNEAEISAVQQSQRAAVAAMKAAIAQIASADISADGSLKIGKTALTSEKVRATINHTLLDHDCTAEETIVAGGPLCADPHERGSGPLFAGQPIVMDIFPRSGKTGYWGDITRTVCRGPAPAALKKQYNAVKAAQAAQLKAVKAGVKADRIHRLGAELMAARGYKTEAIDGVPQGFIHGTGHGVGLEIHEAPSVSPANKKNLRAGQIITIEPGLYYPDIGGVRIEDTVAVTKDGYKMLCPCPKKLEI
jgi:Xaa-Pro aminopeptidase